MFANLVLLLKVSAVTIQNTVHLCRRAFAMAVIVSNSDANSVPPPPKIMDNIFHLQEEELCLSFFSFCWKRMHP